MTPEGKQAIVNEITATLFRANLDAISADRIMPIGGATQEESNQVVRNDLNNFGKEVKQILERQDEDTLSFLFATPDYRWFDAFKIYLSSGIDAKQALEEEFGDAVFINESLEDLTQEKNQSGFGDSFGNHPFVAYLNKMLTNAVIKDSGNRVQSFKKSVESNLSELTDLNTAILSNFGEEAGTLFLEILDGLDLQEQERLGKASKRAPKAEKVAEKVAQEEEVSLDELDFLDQEIEDVISLEELEDELNLDDLNLD